jgi:hypothetical protein
MDWTQLMTLAGYTTGVCYFFYRLNEKSIEKNEAHWREMFMYMSGRIDNVGKGMTPEIQTQKNPP